MNNTKLLLLLYMVVIFVTIFISLTIAIQNKNIEQLNDKVNTLEFIIKDSPNDDYTIPEQLTGNYNLLKEN